MLREGGSVELPAFQRVGPESWLDDQFFRTKVYEQAWQHRIPLCVSRSELQNYKSQETQATSSSKRNNGLLKLDKRNTAGL